MLRRFLHFCFLVVATTITSGATYYVDQNHPSASNSNPGTASQPFLTIGQGLQSVGPGDTVLVMTGTYNEILNPSVSGNANARIYVLGRGDVTVTNSGRVLSMDERYYVFRNLIIDGQYGTSNTVRIFSDAGHTVIDSCVIRRSSRDLVFITNGDSCAITNSTLELALRWENGAQVDAHAITGRMDSLLIQNDTIRNFSGDAIQFDPDRNFWTDVWLVDCVIYEETLTEETNGFPAGFKPGENAVDFKTPSDGPAAKVYMINNQAWGFDGDFSIGSRLQASFNVKERVDALLKNNITWSNEVSFRLRGGNGCTITCINNVTYDCDRAFRIEDGNDGEDFIGIYNNTVGTGVNIAINEVENDANTWEFLNNVFVSSSKPPEASDPSNVATLTNFTDLPAHNYLPTTGNPAIDAGQTLSFVLDDIRGIPRPSGPAYDAGAYEVDAGGDTTPPATPQNVRVTK